MKRVFNLFPLAALAVAGLMAGCTSTCPCAKGACACAEPVAGAPKYQPRLFKAFGEINNVPDGLTQDGKGNIYHSAPNLRDHAYPGVILKRCVKTGKWSIFVAGTRNPKTGVGRPMGLEWCFEDGNLYYCDNQYNCDSKDYASRVMRVVIDQKTGEPLRIETAVDNIKLANAIRFYKGDMFFTDTYFDLNRPDGIGIGGVYRVPLKDCKNKVVSLLKKQDYKKDPYFLFETQTKELPGRQDNSGADGLAITKEGHLYFGTFGSGRFYTAKRQANGTYAPAKLIFENPKLFPCCDGICYDEAENRIIMSDSCLNALHTWSIDKELKGEYAFGELWKNGDNDGSTGLFDQPCEPMVWRCPKTGKRKCIVANFDMTFPGLTNKTDDKFHTLSILDLE